MTHKEYLRANAELQLLRRPRPNVKRPGFLRKLWWRITRSRRSEWDRQFDVLESCPDYWDEYVAWRDSTYTEVLR